MTSVSALDWEEHDRGDVVATLGPLTLVLTPRYRRDTSLWWKREIEGWSWRFGPTSPTAFRSVSGLTLATIDAGAIKPGEHLPIDEAKAACHAAALAFGRAIIGSGEAP